MGFTSKMSEFFLPFKSPGELSKTCMTILTNFTTMRVFMNDKRQLNQKQKKNLLLNIREGKVKD